MFFCFKSYFYIAFVSRIHNEEEGNPCLVTNNQLVGFYLDCYMNCRKIGWSLKKGCCLCLNTNISSIMLEMSSATILFYCLMTTLFFRDTLSLICSEIIFLMEGRFVKIPFQPPAIRQVMINMINGADKPFGVAKYLGSHWGVYFALYSWSPLKL